MLVAFGIHLFTYTSVNGLLTGLWALDRGTYEDLPRMVQDPALITKLHFWPIWVLLPWTALLLIHLGAVLSVGLFGRRARRRRAELARQAGKAAELLAQKAKAHHHGGPFGGGCHRTEPEGPPPSNRIWVTAMFTDVVGSTNLAEVLGDEEWSRLLAGHRDFVRATLAAWHGTLVNTQGDGCLARFADATDALQCAVQLQEELARLRTVAEFPLHVRVGLHAGEAVEDDGGDLVGKVINIAARVTGEAETDEILITEPVAEHVPAGMTLEDRGLRSLRGVSQSRHLLAVAWRPEPAPTVDPSSNGHSDDAQLSPATSNRSA